MMSFEDWRLKNSWVAYSVSTSVPGPRVFAISSSEDFTRALAADKPEYITAEIHVVPARLFMELFTVTREYMNRLCAELGEFDGGEE